MDINELLFTAVRASFVYFFLLLVVALWHLVNSWASFKSDFIDRLVNSPARLLIDEGKLVQEGLQREWMRQETLQFELRLNGEEHPREVREARLETEGKTSVLKVDSHKPVQKKDVRRLLR